MSIFRHTRGRGASFNLRQLDEDARIYLSNVEVTRAGSEKTARYGLHCPSADFDVLSLDDSFDPPELKPNDGQAFLRLPSGRFLLLGGAPNGHYDYVVNTIWCSDDQGKTWSVLLAGNAGSSTRPPPSHTFVCFLATYGGTPYVYWIGSDPSTPGGDVFRIAASHLDVGGTETTAWSLVNVGEDPAPTANSVLSMYGVASNGDLYIIGGQESLADASPKTPEVWVSEDEGATWTDTGHDCPADVWGMQLGPLPFIGGKFYVCGSGRYDDTPATYDFSDAVYTYEPGVGWAEVLPDGHEQFPSTRYHSCVGSPSGRLWRFNGTAWDRATTISSDTCAAHYSDDLGATWHEVTIPLPWPETHAQAAIATADGIYLTTGFATPYGLYVIREHAGGLVSMWADQGDGAKDLVQATEAKRPLFDATAYNGRGGIVFSKAQLLELAASYKDVAAGGKFEAWIVVKSLAFDNTGGSVPPTTLVGAVDGSSWNSFGLGGADGELRYVQANGGYTSIEPTANGTGYNDDRPHLLGIQHEHLGGGAGRVTFFVDGVQVGDPITTDVGYSTDYTGWNALGAGLSEGGKGEFVAGMAFIRPNPSAFLTTDQIAKLKAYAVGNYGTPA